MNRFLVIALFATLLIANVVCIENENNDQNIKSIENNDVENDQSVENDGDSIKTKRGIIGYYTLPSPGLTKYRFPGFYKGLASPGYTLSPGSASVHSFSVNYPKVYYPKPVLRPAFPSPAVFHTKPIYYANRYPHPFFVPKPVIPVAAPQPAFLPAPPQPAFLPAPPQPAFLPAPPQPAFLPAPHQPAFLPAPTFPTSFAPTPAFAPSFLPFGPTPLPHPIGSTLHTDVLGIRPQFIPSILPQPTLVSQNGWKPLFGSTPAAELPTNTVRPSVTVLPPLPAASDSNPGVTQRPYNYYLPPDNHLQQLNEVPSHSSFTQEELAHANGKIKHIFQ